MKTTLLFKVPGPPLVFIALFSFALLLFLVFALPRILAAWREHRVKSAEDAERIERARQRALSASFEPLGGAADAKRPEREREGVPRE